MQARGPLGFALWDLARPDTAGYPETHLHHPELQAGLEASAAQHPTVTKPKASLLWYPYLSQLSAATAATNKDSSWFRLGFYNNMKQGGSYTGCRTFSFLSYFSKGERR